MSGQVNGKTPLDRTRLCELAKVARGKHIRWTKDRLLTAKQEYGEFDLIRAAILDELTLVVKPSLAKTAWLQVEKDLDAITPNLQVIVCTTTKRAYAVHDSSDLDRLLPRNEPVIVVELAERVKQARSRLREFRNPLDDLRARGLVREPTQPKRPSTEHQQLRSLEPVSDLVAEQRR
jgi:hypothetical protein